MQLPPETSAPAPKPPRRTQSPLGSTIAAQHRRWRTCVDLTTASVRPQRIPHPPPPTLHAPPPVAKLPTRIIFSATPPTPSSTPLPVQLHCVPPVSRGWRRLPQPRTSTTRGRSLKVCRRRRENLDCNGWHFYNRYSCLYRSSSLYNSSSDEEYLRAPNSQDTARLFEFNKNLGFLGMLGSIDCMH
jgi:hypothetical protein